MEINLSTINHSALGQRSLEDMVNIIGHQLKALGHRVISDNTLWVHKDNGINLIFEGFEPQSIEEIGRAHAIGCRFVIVATEEPTPQGFNYGIGAAQLKTRQDIFPEAAKYAEGILHLVPGKHITDWYAQHAPAAQAELGYAPGLVNFAHNKQPRWDFGFYGSLSNRRMSILRRLGRFNYIRVLGNFQSAEERDEMVQNCKIILQIRKYEKMGLVSSSRCLTSLCLGRPVLAEPHELSKPWDEIVRFARSLDTFIETAIVMRSMWKGVHQDQFDKLRSKLTPEFCIGEPLRRIGIYDGCRALAA